LKKRIVERGCAGIDFQSLSNDRLPAAELVQRYVHARIPQLLEGSFEPERSDRRGQVATITARVEQQLPVWAVGKSENEPVGRGEESLFAFRDPLTENTARLVAVDRPGKKPPQRKRQPRSLAGMVNGTGAAIHGVKDRGGIGVMRVPQTATGSGA
jgi:hypothetical protein